MVPNLTDGHVPPNSSIHPSVFLVYGALLQGYSTLKPIPIAHGDSKSNQSYCRDYV